MMFVLNIIFFEGRTYQGYLRVANTENLIQKYLQYLQRCFSIKYYKRI